LALNFVPNCTGIKVPAAPPNIWAGNKEVGITK
jgi:hypothetical protein